MAEYIDFMKYPDSRTIEELLLKLNETDRKNIELFSIGRSWEGKKICAARVGKGNIKILIAGGFEAAEALGSLIIINYVYELSECVRKDKLINGYDIKRLLSNTTYYFIPCINPDSLDINKYGINKESIYYEKQKALFTEASVWKGNSRGVMLNRNFPAGWSRDACGRSGHEFGGEFPESENESRALGGFTRSVRPNCAIILSDTGETIKYDSGGYILSDAEQTAVIFSSITGLRLEKTGMRAGTYSDWFIDSFAKNAYNIKTYINKENVFLMNSKLREIFTIAPFLIK